MSTVYLKTGDTRTGISATLFTPGGSPVDLSGAEVRFKMSDGRRITPVIDREAIIIDAAAGRVAFAFELGETDKSGAYRGEFLVEYPDGSNETFPNEGYILINIGRSLQ